MSSVQQVKQKTYLKKAERKCMAGWIWIAFAIIPVFMAKAAHASDGTGGFVGGVLMAVLFVGIGVIMLKSSMDLRKKAIKFGRYVSIVREQKSGFIENIAAIYPTTYEKACQDLQEMVRAGYFAGAVVDLNSRQLVLAQKKAEKVFAASVGGGTNAKPKAPMSRTIQCPNCGATNTVEGDTSLGCEYCGSPL